MLVPRTSPRMMKMLGFQLEVFNEAHHYSINKLQAVALIYSYLPGIGIFWKINGSIIWKQMSTSLIKHRHSCVKPRIRVRVSALGEAVPCNRKPLAM